MHQTTDTIAFHPFLYVHAKFYSPFLQIENVSIHSSKNSKTKAALIRGQRSVISRDFPLYKWAFEKHGYFVDEPHIFRSNKKNNKIQ
ncbi:hypothetical protein B4U80_10199 [Leptotrombidium deliense]|uniref:Uncharacterized protein n=1 Tax=Leptotrombidium deliense TaxID=299467 RepID=A0A443SAM4_9ACAR|nr:hypothetical protein B4U80_10199 [Leptotrombidium deliense]